ncbi:MAG TPA: phosphatidate cytidylyltransferase [Firmicutes bacterium]|nr:phosphatidate cytidylyltransferase [Bacillota bacterium]
MSGTGRGETVSRVLTGLVGMAVMLGVAYAGGVLFQGAVAFVSAVMLWEYRRLAAAGGGAPTLSVLLAAGVGTAVLTGVGRLQAVAGLLFLALAVEAGLGLIRFPEGGFLRRLGALAFGAVYVGVPLGLWIRLRTGSFWLLAAGFILIWANDVFAYAVGVNLGRHRLAPRVSPKKSVEGAVGGLVAAGIAAIVVRSWLGLGPGRALGVGLAVALAGQVGDLVESALKREAGLKDSGRILPGHGGFLDRFDSSLLGFPVLYFLVRLLG